MTIRKMNQQKWKKHWNERIRSWLLPLSDEQMTRSKTETKIPMMTADMSAFRSSL